MPAFVLVPLWVMTMPVAASLPDRIATAVPMTAVPLRGYARQLVPRVEGMGISVMSIVGNFDQVMPIDGGESYEGFIYDSQSEYIDAWAAYHGALPGPPTRNGPLRRRTGPMA